MTHIQPRSVLLATKRGHAKALELAEKISSWLDEQGVVNCFTENLEDISTCIPRPEPVLILVLGGDGTMISVAGKLCRDDTVILGINFARVGFLTECPRESWQEVLESIIRSGVAVSSRMLLDVRVIRDGKNLLSTVAVNDIVVGRSRLARLINLEFFVGEERVTALRADGLILATPTGSSAYSCSAGGPLVFPELDVICITPVCSFLTELKPFILPAEKRISVRVDDDTLEAFLTLDGQIGFSLLKGDTVHVTRSARRMHLAVFPGSSYFQKLKAKGFLQEG